MKTDFIKRQEGDFDEQERIFVEQLITYAVSLGITPEELASVTNTVNNHRAAYAIALQKANEAKAANIAKYNLKDLAIAEIRKLAAKIKTSSAYTQSIGQQLAIIAQEQTLDLNNVQPIISEITQLIDMNIFDWAKKNMHGIIIFGAKRNIEQDTVITTVDSSTVNNHAGISIASAPELIFEEIGRDYRSPWEDKRLNLTNKPETRYYKFMYLYKDQPVGIFSPIYKIITEIYQR